MAIGTIADGSTSTTTAGTGTGNISLMAAGDSSPTAVTSPGGANTAITGTGDTSTSSVSCPGCCGQYYLPALFGNPTGGICPAGVTNSVPVTLSATVTITPASGISLATYCLPTSSSFYVTTSNPLYPSALFLSGPATACTTVTPPTTRLYPAWGGVNSVGWLFFVGDPNMYVDMAACDCSTSRAIAFRGSQTTGTLIRAEYDCSIPSITYGQGNVWFGSTRIGSWKVTFTP